MIDMFTFYFLSLTFIHELTSSEHSQVEDLLIAHKFHSKKTICKKLCFQCVKTRRSLFETGKSLKVMFTFDFRYLPSFICSLLLYTLWLIVILWNMSKYNLNWDSEWKAYNFSLISSCSLSSNKQQKKLVCHCSETSFWLLGMKVPDAHASVHEQKLIAIKNEERGYYHERKTSITRSKLFLSTLYVYVCSRNIIPKGLFVTI